MKKIKIRFVARCTSNGTVKDYLIQQKKWYGWRYLGVMVMGGYGGSYLELYCKDTKIELLDFVIHEHFKTTKAHVSITEYPELKTY